MHEQNVQRDGYVFIEPELGLSGCCTMWKHRIWVNLCICLP